MELHEAVIEAYRQSQAVIDAKAGFATRLLHIDGNNWQLLGTGDRTFVAKFLLREFPNCSAMTIAYGLEVAEEMRGKGIGQALQNMRMLASRLAGFSAMTATVRDDNDTEQHILSKLGWHRTFTGLKSRHGGTVSVWMVDLNG